MSRVGAAVGSLGKHYQNAQPPPPEKLTPEEGEQLGKTMRIKRFTLQEKARKILFYEQRLKSCCRVPSATIDGPRRTVAVHTKNNSYGGKSASFKGLVRCGSVWLCPVCSNTISLGRRDQLQGAIEAAGKKGLHVAFLTLTAPHHVGEYIGDLIKRMRDARRRFKNRKPYKKLMESLGYKGEITTLEVTYGDNGWHVHTHTLLFLENPWTPSPYLSDNAKHALVPMLKTLDKSTDWQEIRELSTEHQLLKQWVSACEDSGFSTPNHHGTTLQDGTKAAEYVSKWGLANELTQAAKKEGATFNDQRKGITPWELLALGNNTDKVKYKLLFQDYAEAFKGQRQLVWSRGLKEYLDVIVLEDDQLVLEFEEEKFDICIGSFDLETWGTITGMNLRGAILQAGERGGWGSIIGVLQFNCPDVPAVSHYNRQQIIDIEIEKELPALVAPPPRAIQEIIPF